MSVLIPTERRGSIQEIWAEDVRRHGAEGPPLLANTAAALAPALWFFEYVGDWGADLVLSKDGERTVVQVKRWNRRISPRAVQEVVAAKAEYACKRAMVVTNSFFTEAATKLALVNKVE